MWWRWQPLSGRGMAYTSASMEFLSAPPHSGAGGARFAPGRRLPRPPRNPRPAPAPQCPGTRRRRRARRRRRSPRRASSAPSSPSSSGAGPRRTGGDAGRASPHNARRLAWRPRRLADPNNEEIMEQLKVRRAAPRRAWRGSSRSPGGRPPTRALLLPRTRRRRFAATSRRSSARAACSTRSRCALPDTHQRAVRARRSPAAPRARGAGRRGGPREDQPEGLQGVRHPVRTRARGTRSR